MTTQPDANDRRQREAGEMTIVERCARKIEPLSWAALGVADTQAHARKRDLSLRKARAVLQAMREPSEGMVKAGAPETEPDSESDGTWEAHLTWRAMIDAALAEHDALDG